MECSGWQDHAEAEDEERIMEEELSSQDFIGMLNFSGREVDSFSLVDQYSSRSVSSEESDSQGRVVNQPDQSQADLSQPEVTRVYVRSHQRTLPDGRVMTIRSHSRSRGRSGRSVTFSPDRVIHPKGKGKIKGKGKTGKQGKRINRPISSEDEQVAESRPVTVRSEDSNQ
eukprot:5434318-Amphidinium_carterae.1